MAITKMVAVTILGRLGEFENIVERYVYNKNIHLENSLSVLGDKKRMTSFEDSGQYDSIASSAEELLKMANIEPVIVPTSEKLTAEDMTQRLEDIAAQVKSENELKKMLVKKRAENLENIEHLKLAGNLNCDISKLFGMQFINAYFGHMPVGAYKMLGTYLRDMEAVFVKTGIADNTDVYGIYFAPAKKAGEMKEVLDSLYFERIFLPGDISGTPKDVIAELEKRNDGINKQLAEIAKSTRKLLESSGDSLLKIYSAAKKRRQYSDVLANAAHSKDYFYIVGWMPERDAIAMEEQADKDESISMFYAESAENMKNIITPPTKLKNNPVFRPFEFFVRMYGLPGYKEIDPTPLLAVTYILFFGMMFGDVGQSALFAIGGFLIYKFKKIDLANIIGICGLSGIVFGFLYGSIFGREDIIHGVLSPMHNITTLLIGTIAMGAVVIVLGLVINIRNCIVAKDKGELFFGHNGIAGLVFYVSLLLLALTLVTPLSLPTGVLGALVGAALLLIFLKEPLSELIDGKKHWLPKDGMFYVQSFFELFEVLLSYFSNTISFLRIGAFAIVHVGMMMAVDMLAQGGTVKVIIVSILGNALVMVMEGLVVGIQVLRLEYYEIFSRYFTGNGKPFNSLKIK